MYIYCSMSALIYIYWRNEFFFEYLFSAIMLCSSSNKLDSEQGNQFHRVFWYKVFSSGDVSTPNMVVVFLFCSKCLMVAPDLSQCCKMLPFWDVTGKLMTFHFFSLQVSRIIKYVIP